MPLDGNCTIFARYVEAAFATQVIMTAQLTRLYERNDWKRRFAETQNAEPLVLARSESLAEITATSPNHLTGELAATEREVAQVMDKVGGKGFSGEKYAKTVERARRAHE